MIYLDYASTTPVNEEVLKSFNIVNTKYWGNPSALHKYGALAESLLEKARKNILNTMNANNYNLLFTSCATEANNLAIKGVAHQYKWRGKHIITTSIEHPSVFNVFKFLENEGYEVTYLSVNDKGLIDIEELKRAIKDDTILVSTMHVNNEVGAMQPIQEIGELLSNYPKVFYHVDLAQSIGKIKYELDDIKVDFASISAHKIYGLKGSGALFLRKSIAISPQLNGGSQEFNIRAGTTDVASAVALAKALRLVYNDINKNYEYVSNLRETIISKINSLKRCVLNSPKEKASPYIINFSVPGKKPETIIHAFEEYEIYLSTQSACSSKKQKPSRVLEAMGLSEDRCNSSLRISLSHLTSEEEIDEFIRVLSIIVETI